MAETSGKYLFAVEDTFDPAFLKRLRKTVLGNLKRKAPKPRTVLVVDCLLLFYNTLPADRSAVEGAVLLALSLAACESVVFCGEKPGPGNVRTNFSPNFRRSSKGSRLALRLKPFQLFRWRLPFGADETCALLGLSGYSVVALTSDFGFAFFAAALVAPKLLTVGAVQQESLGLTVQLTRVNGPALQTEAWVFATAKNPAENLPGLVQVGRKRAELLAELTQQPPLDVAKWVKEAALAQTPEEWCAALSACEFEPVPNGVLSTFSLACYDLLVRRWPATERVLNRPPTVESVGVWVLTLADSASSYEQLGQSFPVETLEAEFFGLGDLQLGLQEAFVRRRKQRGG